MFLPWIWLLLALSSVSCLENEKKNEVQFVVEYPGNRTYCDKMEVIKWTSAFHECFIDRKYKDGGANLESIVDRILQHAGACQETSIQQCQPDFRGFKDIMEKIISQIKDYSEMYLEEIVRGRENIKDLECVETSLSLNNYVKCFQTQLQSPSVSQKSFERNVKESISCVDRANQGCSIEAKSSLNRIVAKIFGIEYKQETKPPLPPTTETPPPESKRWYDYIFQPFISAWEYIKSFFG